MLASKQWSKYLQQVGTKLIENYIFTWGRKWNTMVKKKEEIKDMIFGYALRMTHLLFLGTQPSNASKSTSFSQHFLLIFRHEFLKVFLTDFSCAAKFLYVFQHLFPMYFWYLKLRG